MKNTHYIHKKNTLILKGGLFLFLLLIGNQTYAECQERTNIACTDERYSAFLNGIDTSQCNIQGFGEIINLPLIEKDYYENFIPKFDYIEKDDRLDPEYLGAELTCELRTTQSCLNEICSTVAAKCLQSPNFTRPQSELEQQISICREKVQEIYNIQKIAIEAGLNSNTDRKLRTVRNEADIKARTQKKQEVHHRIADTIRQMNRFASKVTVFIEEPLNEQIIAETPKGETPEEQQKSREIAALAKDRLIASVNTKEPVNEISDKPFWSRLQTSIIPLIGEGGAEIGNVRIPANSSLGITGSSTSNNNLPTYDVAGKSASALGSTASAAASGLQSIIEIPFNAIAPLTKGLQTNTFLKDAASIYLGSKLLAGKGPLEMALGSAGISGLLGSLSTGVLPELSTLGLANSATNIGINAAKQYLATEIGGSNPLIGAFALQGINGILGGGSIDLKNLSLEKLSLSNITGTLTSLPSKLIQGVGSTVGGALTDVGRIFEEIGKAGNSIFGTTPQGSSSSSSLLGNVLGSGAAPNAPPAVQYVPSNNYVPISNTPDPTGPAVEYTSDGTAKNTYNDSYQRAQDDPELADYYRNRTQSSLNKKQKWKFSLFPTAHAQEGLLPPIGEYSAPDWNPDTDSLLPSLPTPTSPTTAVVTGAAATATSTLIESLESTATTQTSAVATSVASSATASGQGILNTASNFLDGGIGQLPNQLLQTLRLDGIAKAVSGSFLGNVGGTYLALQLGGGDPLKTFIAQSLVSSLMASITAGPGGTAAQANAAASASGTSPATTLPKSALQGPEESPFGDKIGVLFTEKLIPSKEGCNENCTTTAQKKGIIYINGNRYPVVSGGVASPHMPTGEYRITESSGGFFGVLEGPVSSSVKKSFTVDSNGDGQRFGFRVGIEGKTANGAWAGDGQVWDPVLRRTRKLIRMHVDGNNWSESDSSRNESNTLGNAGCLSPIGDEETMKRFYNDLTTVVKKGSAYKEFEVRDCGVAAAAPTCSSSGEALQGDPNSINYTSNKSQFITQNSAFFNRVANETNSSLANKYGAGNYTPINLQDISGLFYSELCMSGHNSCVHSEGERGMFPLPEQSLSRWLSSAGVTNRVSNTSNENNITLAIQTLAGYKNDRAYRGLFNTSGLDTSEATNLLAGITHGYGYSGAYRGGKNISNTSIAQGFAQGKSAAEVLSGTNYVHAGKQLLVNRDKNLIAGKALASCSPTPGSTPSSSAAQGAAQVAAQTAGEVFDNSWCKIGATPASSHPGKEPDYQAPQTSTAVANPSRSTVLSGGVSAYGNYPSSKTSQQSTVSHAVNEAALSAAGVTWSATENCSNPLNPKCTALRGIHEELIKGVIALKRACKCDVIVTGGTETGHSATLLHGEGNAVDLRLINSLSQFLQTESNQAGKCTKRSVDTDCVVMNLNGGKYNFHKEGHHWHVEFKGGTLAATLYDFIDRELDIPSDILEGAGLSVPEIAAPIIDELNPFGNPDTPAREPGVITNPLDTMDDVKDTAVQAATQSIQPTFNYLNNLTNFISPTPTPTPTVTIPYRLPAQNSPSP